MYVKIFNGQPVCFPYNLSQLKSDNPNTSFPATISASTLADYSVYEVVLTPRPIVDSSTHIVTQTVKEIDGTWTQTWNVEQLPKDQAVHNVRADRSERLADCDWTQLPDAPVDRGAWANYRQALRDVTVQPGFPWNVQWPESP